LLPWFLALLGGLPGSAFVAPSVSSAFSAGFTSWLPVGLAGVPHFARRRCGSAGRSFFNLIGLFRVFEFEEVGYIEERVALQAHVHKSGLHAGEDSCYAAVVNGARECVFVFAFVVDFRELIVF
jgi:hypothetical protein